MPISNTPPVTPFPVWSTDQTQPAVERYASIPTPADMRRRMLFGIPLKSAFTQQEVTDETLQDFITQAISEVEHTLDLYITPVTFVEKHDYIRENFTWNYNYLKVNHPNILTVSKVELSFTNSMDPALKGFVNFPLEHVHVMPQEGVIQLVPAFGTSLSGFLLSAFSGTQFHALRAIGITNFPGGVRVQYTSGFNENQVPAILTALIETIAAIRTLSVLGPILFPHNSVSISMDGASQTTSTLGPAFLQKRMDDLQRQKEEQLNAAKAYYQRGFLIDWF
jgi:hypothetical protein